MKKTNVINDFCEIFLNYKIEFIICMLGFIFSSVMFKYVDGISLQAWALETSDAFFRGGIGGFGEIIDQNLWKAPHGVAYDFGISNIVYTIWNIPLVLIHYIFNTGYTISFAARMWGKLLWVLLTLLLGYVSYKIADKITGKKNQSMMAAILTWGAPSVMASVGFAMQDEVLYMLFIALGLYYAICGKKNLSLFWICLSCFTNPVMLIIVIIIIIYSSDNIVEMVCRILAAALLSVLQIFSINTASGGGAGSEISKILDQFNLTAGIGTFSVVAAVILIAYFMQWSAKSYKAFKQKYLVWLLILLSLTLCMLSSNTHYRFMICIPFIATGITLIDSREGMTSGITALFIFEVCRMWIMIVSKAFLRLYAFPDSLREFWGTQSFVYGTSATVGSVITSLYPWISDFTSVITGLAFAGAVWIVYVCWPNRKKELACNMPVKVITSAYCLIQIIIMVAVFLLLMKVTAYDAHYNKKINVSPQIDGQNIIEEYYHGKSADKLLISVIPCTAGNSYSNDQLLMLDIVDTENNMVIATASYNASDLKDGKAITFQIEDANIKNDKEYLLRFYSSKIIDDPNCYMYLYRLNDENDASDKTASEYDYVSMIIGI